MTTTKPTDLKKTIASALVGLSLVVTQVGGGNVEICDTNTSKCVTVSASQFDGLERSIADKIAANTPLSWDEYNLAVAAVDHEIGNGIRITGAQNDTEIKKQIINILYGN